MKTRMQTLIWSLALAGGLLAAMPAQAQDQAQGERPRQERRQGGPGGMNVEALKEQLGLTDEQVEKLKPILAAQREEITAKRKELGEDADRAKVREAMQAVREKYTAQIDAILTAEQKEKMAKLRERGAGRRQGGPGAPGAGAGEGATPPPPPPAPAAE
jgi:Spy/CpxP family protein refolding chaperone